MRKRTLNFLIGKIESLKYIYPYDELIELTSIIYTELRNEYNEDKILSGIINEFIVFYENEFKTEKYQLPKHGESENLFNNSKEIILKYLNVAKSYLDSESENQTSDSIDMRGYKLLKIENKYIDFFFDTAISGRTYRKHARISEFFTDLLDSKLKVQFNPVNGVDLPKVISDEITLLND